MHSRFSVYLILSCNHWINVCNFQVLVAQNSSHLKTVIGITIASSAQCAAQVWLDVVSSPIKMISSVPIAPNRNWCKRWYCKHILKLYTLKLFELVNSSIIFSFTPSITSINSTLFSGANNFLNSCECNTRYL